jgi:shikimate kinase
MPKAPETPNLLLTGFMGTGKSTLGRVLAYRWNRAFVDTDELIEKSTEVENAPKYVTAKP